MKSSTINVTLVLLVAASLQLVCRCYVGPRVARLNARPTDSADAASSLSGGLEPGLILQARNWVSIDTHARLGKSVQAQVTHDIVMADGPVIVPRKSMLFGHVAEVQKRDKAHPESRLRIVFDSIQLRHGRKLVFTGIIEAVQIVEEPTPYESEEDCCRLPKAVEGWVSMASTIRGEDTGQGVVLHSVRDFYLDSDTRFTVRVVASPSAAK